MENSIINPFESFWMAGFECTDQLNAHGDRVDFLHLTSHFELILEDYSNLMLRGIHVVREGVRWSQVETSPYVYDFSSLKWMIEAGKVAGIQQVWDLCHFGFPDDISPMHPHFTRRFVSFCRAFAEFYGSVRWHEHLVVTPVNEVGFISWLGGEVAGTSPYSLNNGWHLKYAYVRAYIAGIAALREIDPKIRILTTEPLVNVVHAPGASEGQMHEAALHNEYQFQVLDMLSGRMCPELGGNEDNLDILGFNYYYDNQWILEPHRTIGWNDEVADPDYRSLHQMLHEVYLRYGKPIVLSETSHPGIDRPLWMKHIGNEVTTLLEKDVPFWGICWYPIIDRPDWDNTDQWHHAGIWDQHGNLLQQKRVLHRPTADALLNVQRSLRPLLATLKNQRQYRTFTNRDSQT